MNLSRASLLLLAIGAWSVPAMAIAQPRLACLHSGTETSRETRRREEAETTTRLIVQVLGRVTSSTDVYPTWQELATSSRLAPYREMPGPIGDLARKINWGSGEPLPGWQILYVASLDAYAFSLTDARDPCRLTYSANDTGVIVIGRPLNRPAYGIVPLDSSQ